MTLRLPAWLERRLPIGKRAQERFCVLPFRNLYALPNGEVKPCCAFNGPIQDGGRPMSLLVHSASQIYDSKHMRRVRRDMAMGRTVPECEFCHLQEARGIVSQGRAMTGAWAAGWTNRADGAARTALEVMAGAAAADFRSSVETVELVLGSACNLRCRMCYSDASSAIAADPVHSSWAPLHSSPFARSEEGSSWSKRKERLVSDLLKDPRRLLNISLFGGETLILKETRDIMRYLIDAGAAERTMLSLFTNGTRITDEWRALAERFKLLVVSVSIDGYRGVNEYIRFPSRWSEIEAGLDRLQRMPNVAAVVNAAVQAYNLLDLVELARFCESRGLEMHPHVISDPPYLSSFVMPAPIRRGAARRLRDYAVGRRGIWRSDMLSLADAWEAAPEPEPELLERFMMFTNDLDVSRGQSFETALPELAQMLREAGVAWTRETRFAREAA